MRFSAIIKSLIPAILLTGFVSAAAPCVIFEKPEQKSRFLVIDSSQLRDTGRKMRQVSVFHPLCRIYEFTEKELPNGLRGYRRHDITVKDDGVTPVRKDSFSSWRTAGMIFSPVAILAILYCIFIRRSNKEESVPEYAYLLLPVLVRCFLVLTCREYGVQPAMADEAGYFQTISDMLNGNFRSQWHFTVGTGFFYLPFILLLRAKEFYDTVPQFNYFAALFLAPGTLALGYLILRKLQVSAGKACIAMLVWALYPFVFFHLEDWNRHIFQYFAYPNYWFSQFNGHFYYSFCINAGFNAMSDIPGLLCVLGCLYMILALPAKLRYAALTGALYGFSCMVRINYILLAPMFALVYYTKFKESRIMLLKAALSSCGAFLAVFSFQMICNTIQFGSPLTFGYVMHYPGNAALDRPAAGFTWHTFSKLTFLRYLFRVNLPVFALGTAALWSMRSRFNQGLLILMSVPVVLFFCGYSHTFCDARRFTFPAFAGFIMAVAALEIWRELPRKAVIMIAAGLLAMILLALPYKAFWRGLPFMTGDGYFLRLAGIIIPVYLTAVIFRLIRFEYYQAALFTFLSAFIFYAPPELAAAGMFLLLPFAAARYLRDIFISSQSSLSIR